MSHDTPSQPFSAHIIIVSYHSALDLRHCLPVLAQTIHDCPVIIVDNAYPDESMGWVRSEYPQWQIIHNANNTGFGQANNLAAQTVTEEFFVFLNPDTVPVNGWLEALLQGLIDTHQSA